MKAQITESVEEMIRFILVGGFSFAVDVSVLILLQEGGLKHIYNGVLISTAAGFIVSVILHYVLAVKWVFRNHTVHSKDRHLAAAVLFVITNLVGLGLNELMMWIGVTILGFYYVLVKVAAAVVVMFWNFSCQKFMIFKRPKQHPVFCSDSVRLTSKEIR